MRGSYRIALAVLAIIAAIGGFQLYQFYQAAEQKDATYNYQPAQKPGYRISSATKAPTPYYKPNCNNPNTREDADLCAQWAVVEQASETNRMTSLNLRLVVLAFIATMIGTAALVWTLIETRMVARRELRAYITAGEHFKVGTEGEGEQPFEFGVVWKNAGKTPAQWLNASINWKDFDEKGLPADFDFPDPEDLTNSFSCLGPGETVDGPEAGIPRWLIDAIKLGTRTVYVWGWAEYNDVFDGSPRRRTEFAFQVVPSNHGTFGIANLTLPTHNDCDESCEKPVRTTPPARRD